MSTKKILAIGFLVLLLCIAAGVFLFRNKEESRILNPSERYQEITATYPDFSKGADLLATGKSDEAAPYFEKSTGLVLQNSTEEVLMKLLLAFSYATSSQEGKFRESVPLFLSIIQNNAYPRDFRARAAEGIIDLYFHRPEVLDILIQHEPYKSLAIESKYDSRLFRQKLLEQSEIIYPLASVEMKLAALYAEELANLHTNEMNVVEKAKQEQLRNSVLNMVAKGLRNLAATEKYEHLNVYIPDTLLGQALAAQYFEQATSETPFGTPQELFEKALREAERYYPPQRSTIERYYNIYLANQ